MIFQLTIVQLKNIYTYPLEKITSKKHLLWTSPYGPLSNSKGSPCPTSWGHSVPTSSGRWNTTSWELPNVISRGRSHIVLHVTPKEVSYQLLEGVSCKHYEDVPYSLICNSKWHVLPTSWGRPSETSRGHPKDVLKWFLK